MSEGWRRKHHAECGAASHGTVDADLPAVQLDEALGQCKPKPGAFRLPTAVLAELLELLEERRLVLRRYADARVFDRDFHLVGIDLRRHVDSPAVGRELDRVREQVEQDLLTLRSSA